MITSNKNRIWIFIAPIIVLVGLTTLIKTQCDTYLIRQNAKNHAESLRLINAMKQHSILSQKAWLAEGKPNAEEESEASQEMDDKQELSQAMSWQKLSPNQKLLMK